MNEDDKKDSKEHDHLPNSFDQDLAKTIEKTTEAISHGNLNIENQF